MILASLSSYSQYPAVKTIGKDTVVIMTIKQGEEINKKFSSLNDSIQLLNKAISETKIEVATLNIQKQKVNLALDTTSQKLLTSDKEVERLNNMLKAKDKQHWKEKANWGGWMFFSFFVTVMVAALK